MRGGFRSGEILRRLLEVVPGTCNPPKLLGVGIEGSSWMGQGQIWARDCGTSHWQHIHGVFLLPPLYLAGKPLPVSAHLHPGSLPSHEAAVKHLLCFLLLLLRKSPSLTSSELQIHPPTSDSPKQGWEGMETSGNICIWMPQAATRATTLTRTQRAVQQQKYPIGVRVGHKHPRRPRA